MHLLFAGSGIIIIGCWLLIRLWLKRHWAEEVHRLHLARRERSGLFAAIDNETHQLGRVYGYLYAATRRLRWLSGARFNHIESLINEVLYQPDSFGQLQRCISEQRPDFYRGWREGQHRYHQMARHARIRQQSRK